MYLLEKHPEEAQFLDEVTAGMADRIHPLHLPLDQMGNGVGGADTYIWFQVSLGREAGRGCTGPGMEHSSKQPGP